MSLARVGEDEPTGTLGARTPWSLLRSSLKLYCRLLLLLPGLSLLGCLAARSCCTPAAMSALARCIANVSTITKAISFCNRSLFDWERRYRLRSIRTWQSMCIWIWREAPVRPLPPRLCVVGISSTCCCIVSIVPTDTLRVSNECMACLAVSCMTVKSWRPRGDSERLCEPKVNTAEL
jgi:hypothetical protein